MKNKYLYLASKQANKIPYSERLNQYIKVWFETNKDTFVFSAEDNFNSEDIEATFESHKKTYKETGKIYIWTGESKNTIFSSEKINHYFRAWHDYIHLNYNLGYSITEESIVCNIQRDMLPNDWHFEKELINAEIIGQAHYYYKNNSFVENQRLFTSMYLNDSINALKKQ
tara:strand:- start:1675 stop:2184 length:510 start_codon:yes stop_codon:yes gene_type:complete